MIVGISLLYVTENWNIKFLCTRVPEFQNGPLA